MSKPETSLTERDQVAIKLKTPAADTPWVNDMILQCRELDLLQAAAVALCGKIKTPDGSPIGVVDSFLQHQLASQAEDYAREVTDRSAKRE